MSILKIAFWGLVGLCLVVLGFANREPVTLRALPDGLAGALGLSPTITMPLFAAIFIGVALGLLVGFIWEWIREAGERARARAQRRELEALRREVERLKTEKHEGKDDVLALLEKTG